MPSLLSQITEIALKLCITISHRSPKSENDNNIISQKQSRYINQIINVTFKVMTDRSDIRINGAESVKDYSSRFSLGGILSYSFFLVLVGR